MSLINRFGIRALFRWIKYRNVDHFELRWREPNGRGWKKVEDYDDVFNPSDIDQPIPMSHFRTHAKARGYYMGEYRLIPIDTRGRMRTSVWQTWFYDGPSIKAERREEQRKQEQWEELLETVKETAEELENHGSGG